MVCLKHDDSWAGGPAKDSPDQLLHFEIHTLHLRDVCSGDRRRLRFFGLHRPVWLPVTAIRVVQVRFMWNREVGEHETVDAAVQAELT